MQQQHPLFREPLIYCLAPFLDNNRLADTCRDGRLYMRRVLDRHIIVDEQGFRHLDPYLSRDVAINLPDVAASIARIGTCIYPGVTRVSIENAGKQMSLVLGALFKKFPGIRVLDVMNGRLDEATVLHPLASLQELHFRGVWLEPGKIDELVQVLQRNHGLRSLSVALNSWDHCTPPLVDIFRRVPRLCINTFDTRDKSKAILDQLKDKEMLCIANPCLESCRAETLIVEDCIWNWATEFEKYMKQGCVKRFIMRHNLRMVDRSMLVLVKTVATHRAHLPLPLRNLFRCAQELGVHITFEAQRRQFLDLYSDRLIHGVRFDYVVMSPRSLQMYVRCPSALTQLGSGTRDFLGTQRVKWHSSVTRRLPRIRLSPHWDAET
jgi:hypothetical protein